MPGQPQTPIESPYKEAQMYVTVKCPDFTGIHTSSYPIRSNVIYLYFF